jgi:serine/threonine protein kinase
MLLGTPYYMAPESVRGAHVLQSPADALAFGILACKMLVGRTPFAPPPLFLAMAGEPIPPPSPDLAGRVDGALCDSLIACLAQDPAKRPTMQTLAGLFRRAQGSRACSLRRAAELSAATTMRRNGSGAAADVDAYMARDLP